MFWIYIILEFIAIYYGVKKYLPGMNKKLNTKGNGMSAWADTQEFWIMFLLIIGGPITLTGLVAWKLLDKLTSKLNLFKDEESK